MHRFPRRWTSAGFTMLELLLVLALLSIITAICLPGYAGVVDHCRVYHSAQMLAADIRVLQARAAAEQSSNYNIYFSSTGLFYNVRQASSQAGFIPPVILRKVYLNTGVTITEKAFAAAANKNILQISSGGNFQDGHIKLQSRQGRVYYVIIAITGRVRIADRLTE